MCSIFSSIKSYERVEMYIRVLVLHKLIQGNTHVAARGCLHNIDEMCIYQTFPVRGKRGWVSKLCTYHGHMTASMLQMLCGNHELKGCHLACEVMESETLHLLVCAENKRLDSMTDYH